MQATTTTTTTPNKSPRRRTKKVDRKLIPFPGVKWMENRGDATAIAQEQIHHLPRSQWQKAARTIAGAICEDALEHGCSVDVEGAALYLLRITQSLDCGETVCLDCGAELEPIFDENDDTNELPEAWCESCNEEKLMDRQVWADTEEE